MALTEADLSFAGDTVNLMAISSKKLSAAAQWSCCVQEAAR